MRSPTGTGAVRGFLKGSCGMVSDFNRVHSLGGGSFDVSARAFIPASRVPASGGHIMRRLHGTTRGTRAM